MGMQRGPVEGFTQQVSLYWNEQLLIYLRENLARQTTSFGFRISRQKYHKTVNCCLHMLTSAKENKAAH